ncbi:FBD-associated F-box protein At5g22730-like isoform X2 [Papaver somniferum]|uniref:FBD-associated F-box protein At5g22730-like isoform X2 n=1 Tax=Papaver somniferum TaxID=3469 RepID=UPI000E6FC8C6|nr:FBD-associated F-box protein At5g22730-like isoform X2 [Papaver somniferum]
MPTRFTLENLSSLVRADMHIWIKREDIGDGVFPEIRAEKKEYYTQLTLRFLRGFHNVKVLTLNGSFLKALGGSPDILDSQPLEFCHLQFLKLSGGSSRDSLRTIFYMLKISPNIKGLYLRLGPQDSFDPVYPFYHELNAEEIRGLAMPCCMIYHLKFVKIKYLRGRSNELNLLASLLKHSMVLEKIILCSRCLNKYHLKEKEEEMEKFREMLLTFPRASANVVISYSVSVWYS